MDDEIHIQPIDIIEPEWTPTEVSMWLAGLVPMKQVTRDELLAEFPKLKK